MFYEILDKKRIAILPLLREFKKDFYLAGGTGLALQIGHRDSIDFDFFSLREINTQKLFNKIAKVFQGYEVLKILEEENTLSVLIDKEIKLSFLTYDYKMIGKFIEEKDLKIASLEDIACMKLSAVTGRASNKDYIDLYFILRKDSLENLFKKSIKKFPNLDTNLILKSLLYFDDIKNEKINFKNNNQVEFKVVKRFLEGKVKEYVNRK
ncbi:MAG: nucleotidyl transferase AbiEii/AbiGii toxin family protein [bacterium]